MKGNRTTMEFETVIGLEIHIQLKTEMKMFCSCQNEPFGAVPNTHVCPVCLGLPGALPVPNRKAIKKAQIMAKALELTLNKRIIFERKNYFYPDLPKGFQITNPHHPVGKDGSYKLLFPENNTVIRWREIHIEEDTAKSMHKQGETWIDFNKSGVPLLEMVTEPDFRTIDDAVCFAKEMQLYARYLDVSDADMEKGRMRLEANISLRKKGDNKLPGYRVELKNINSFTFMKKALYQEVKRQQRALEQGKKLTQQTRGWDEKTRTTVEQRKKEEVHDYRYFPEPDIPPIVFEKADFERLGRNHVTPKDIVKQLGEQGVSKRYQHILAGKKELSAYALKAIKNGHKYALSANAVASEIINKKINISKIDAAELVKLLVKKLQDTVSDEQQLRKWSKEAILMSPASVSDFQKGKTQAIGPLIGDVMKKSHGKADAKLVKEILEKMLGEQK